MLTYLVTSKARRRLLTLLWSEQARGTATQLAAVAHVSFASAYRELQAMKRNGAAASAMSDGGEVFQAHEQSPDADLLRRLVSPPSARVESAASHELRAHLAEAGLPVHAEPPNTGRPPLPALVAHGLVLARRDPDVARGFPVLLVRVLSSGETTLDELSTAASRHGVGHLLGFFLSLAARFTADHKLELAARDLRDHRVKNQALFETSKASDRSPRFPLARAWGLHMRADQRWFEDLFRKFVPAEVV